MPNSYEVGTPAGDISREAPDARRGYLYQDYQVALNWLELNGSDVLFVEVAEDYVTASGDTLVATQVKDVSSPISLANRNVLKALASFVELTQLNAHKKLTYTFVTTAEATLEKSVKHQAAPVGGIAYWDEARRGADIEPLRQALLAMKLDPALRIFIEARTNDELRNDLIARVFWLVGSKPIDDLRLDLTEKVVARCRELRIERAEAKKFANNVVFHVSDVARRKSRDERRLDRQGLEDFLSHLAYISISRKRYSELLSKAVIAENLPKQALDQLVQERVTGIRSSRSFVGYDRIAAATALSVDVGTHGKYAGASDDVRAMAMSWAARLLLDDKPEVAQELIDTASALAPDAESVLLTNAIRTAGTAVAAAMAMLGQRTSPESMTARYIIQRRAKQGPGAVATAIEWFKNSGMRISDFDEDGQALILGDLMHSGLWIDATKLTDSAIFETTEHPHLLLNCALVALCGAAPEERRDQILDMPPLWDPLGFPLSATVDGSAARAKAIEYFQKLREVAERLKLDAVRDYALEYLLWLRLAESPVDTGALSEVERLVGATEGWQRWVPLALSCGLAIDLGKVRQQLRQSYVLLGSHDFLSARALLATFLATATQATAVDWREIRPQLAAHFHENFLVSLEVQAHLRDGAVADARAAMSSIVDSPDTARMKRQMEILILRQGGDDVLAQRRDEFARTGHTFELEQLVISLEESKQWRELATNSFQLFLKLKSVESAERYVQALISSNQWKELVDFFTRYPEFAKVSARLSNVYAQTAFFLGKWAEVRDASTSSVPGRMFDGLRLQVSLLSLQWHEFNAQIDSALEDHGSCTPNSLLQLAEIAAVLGRTQESRSLVALATEAAPDDPQILFSAFIAATKGKWDAEEAPGEWLKSAVEHPNNDAVIEKKSVADLVELAPIWRERSEKAWSAIRSGEIWLDAYGKWINQQLSQITVGVAITNREETDVRKRSIIPAFSGARQPLSLAIGKRVALDPSALLNLAYLDLLGYLSAIYSTIFVPHRTGAWLFQELRDVEFHQPRRIEEARQLLGFIAKERIEICPEAVARDRRLVAQVGIELADLLARAKEIQASGHKAFVIRTSPVHLIDSLLQKEATLGAYGDVLRSLVCLVDSLGLAGALDSREKQKARAYLSRVDQGWDGDANIPMGAVLLLDDLAVTYLQHLGLLTGLAKANYQLVIHRQLWNQANDFDALGNSGLRLRELLFKVRKFLAEGVRSRLVEVLPSPYDNWGKNDEFASCSTDIFSQEGRFDSILVDDRFFNRYTAHQQECGTTIPINCTLDVLDYLRDAGAITGTDWSSYRTELRRSGYALIPTHASELKAAVDGHPLVRSESLELRSIRESVSLMQVRGVLNLPLESMWLDALMQACNEMLGNVVQAPALSGRVEFAEWLLALTDLKDFGESLASDLTFEQINGLRYPSLFRLLTEAMFRNEPLESSDDLAEIFESLRWESSPAHDWLVNQCRRALVEFKDKIELEIISEVGRQYVAAITWRGILGLPKSLREALLDDEVLLGRLTLKFTPELTLRIPGSPRFDREKIYSAVAMAVNECRTVEVQDRDGGLWSIFCNSEGKPALDLDGEPRILLFPDIEFMSPDVTKRVAHLESKCAKAGVDVNVHFSDLALDLMSGPFSAYDVERAQLLFEEFPLPLYQKLIGELSEGETTLGLMFPSSLSYYEHLVGPWHGESDIRAFAMGDRARCVTASFETQLLACLLCSGHSATSPHEMIRMANADSIQMFIAEHGPGLDVWSMTGLLEGLLTREDVLEELGNEILEMLENFDRILIQDTSRLELAVALVKVADVRIRSLSAESDCPPYWRRLAAIAHGAIIERALLGARTDLSSIMARLEVLQIPYNSAAVVDMHREPRWAPLLMCEHQLRQELLGRVMVLWATNVESNPNFVEHRNKYGQIIEKLRSQHEVIGSSMPGPTEGGFDLSDVPAELNSLLENHLDDLSPSNAIQTWVMIAMAGTSARLPALLRKRVQKSIEQYGVVALEGCEENRAGYVLAWLGFLAASSRDTDLGDAVIRLARELLVATDSGTTAMVCLYVTSYAAAAYADRDAWRKILIGCAVHAAFTCSNKVDAVNCLAALDGFGAADWRLQLPLARARAALKAIVRRV